MPRSFALISMDEFNRKFDSVTGENGLLDYRALENKVAKDLKVDFDLENVGENYIPKNIIGVHVLPNGLVYRGIMAGGDWEHPLFWIVYWDGRRLRAYIPTDGNPYNTDTMQAYGNDPEADGKNIGKRYPDLYDKHLDDKQNWYRCEGLLRNDPKKIIADIENRIQPRKKRT